MGKRYMEAYKRSMCPISGESLERFIFLDIDGVLNTIRYSNYLIDNDCDDTDEDGHLFDPEAVDNLALILNSVPDVKLVISSSWRFKGWKWMNNLWAKRKLPSTIFSMTPGLEKVLFYTDISQQGSYSVFPYGTRGLEISEWLRINASNNPLLYKYVIIDDDNSDFLLIQKDHLIQTDPRYGITKEIAVRIIELLL